MQTGTEKAKSGPVSSLPKDQFIHLIEHHLKAWREGNLVKVAITTSGKDEPGTCPLPQIDCVYVCTHPPCP